MRSITLPPPSSPTASARGAVLNLDLDLPENLMEYTKLKAVIQLEKTAHKSKERQRVMTMMRELKYVPCSNRKLYCYLDMDITCLPIEDSLWNGSGAPPLLTDDDVEEFVAMCCNQNRGMTYCSSAVKKFIVSKKREAEGPWICCSWCRR